jgi:hypothetical protein
MLYRLNAHRPAKKIERWQTSKRAHSARPKSRFEEAIDRVAGGKSSNRSRRCVRLSREALRSGCVFGKSSRDRATR